MYSFSVRNNIKSNKYFSTLSAEELSWDLVGLCFGRPLNNALWIFNKPYKRAEIDSSRVIFVSISRLMTLFLYKMSNKLSTNSVTQP